jgi:hypothetical protein
MIRKRLDMEEELNPDLIAQTLGFHGLPLIKTWNEEKGANSLTRLGLQQANIDTSVYHTRIKILNFTDRTKRLRLHRFICDKTDSLFKNVRENPTDRRIKKLITSGGNEPLTAIKVFSLNVILTFLGDSIPPLEFFASIDKDERFKRFFSVI